MTYVRNTWPCETLGVTLKEFEVKVEKNGRSFTTKTTAIMAIDARQEIFRKLPYQWWGATITVKEV